MKKLAMTLILFVVVSITTGCSHSGWVKFEEQTRIASTFGGPMALVGAVAKIGRLVVRDDGMAVSHGCNPPGDSTSPDVDK